MTQTLNTLIAPENRLAILSRAEIHNLLDSSQGGLYRLLRNCALAVLNCGSDLDDGKALLERYPDFDIRVFSEERGIQLELQHAPAEAFVDGKIIAGIREHLFAVLRDIVYVENEIIGNPAFNLEASDAITDAVFHILRNADIIRQHIEPKLVVCWGGHSISGVEYRYSKEVGYHLGLRDMDICTDCGPGAMKGPMKGATIAHAKQRMKNGRYIGITEPGIIAAESPNPIVNELVIMPDIEKRLEAFVRCGHGIIVFPGGAGTAEEILYLLGVLLHPDNLEIPFPLIFTGPAGSADYFKQINHFIGDTLGFEAQQRYKIIINDPARVGREMLAGLHQVREYRKGQKDAYYFNWSLKIDPVFQQPFDPTHQAMAELNLSKQQAPHQLAANLRRAFSGIVAGNVKEEGIRRIEESGHFEISGDSDIMAAVDNLLASFVREKRMKLPGSVYQPCYKIIR
ncbi:nucleotide 5'-monophosphate nucleosidase PpnN [methane-oxidizing endosymbiont of Gigantopelta aegis]|uniref:nucleotide 5'-monophosphate nucleosidase PpnN n=1 Tax=methane-oxidizing endosymbiont of Gigantopelta aegis TaxID=2794938 RepID=UPI0018DC21B2|nr:nucleotide 5'-monophosphate nucleosidase PpnN [methane-oxidizing endosymbiont of Gigantopelta aegis]